VQDFSSRWMFVIEEEIRIIELKVVLKDIATTLPP
jgi:hypothetical protein